MCTMIGGLEMSKFLVWCFNNTKDARTENKTFSEKAAQRMYCNAIKSGNYSSVVLRREERTHGYAIRSWSEDEGEVLY